MRNRLIALALVATLIGAPAYAGEGGEAKKDEKVGQYVDLAPVALPIIVNGQLINYVFAYVRINLNNGVNSIKLREKEPFFRDALVRAAHRTPFVNPSDYMVVDEVKVKTTLYREAVAITGPGVVKSIEITSQAPKNRTGVPKPRQVSANR